jgi:hypothetical protein
MNRTTFFLILVACAMSCAADDAPPPAPPAVQSPAPAQSRAMPVLPGGVLATRPRQAVQAVPASAASAASPSPSSAAADSSEPVKFSSQAKWLTAGYNNNEIVYTVEVTNQDSRILRCTTEVKGFFFEQGKKLDISDRQMTTVFPNQPTRVGTWMDMDQPSGASYSVKCKPV